jgi:hypothetical protein
LTCTSENYSKDEVGSTKLWAVYIAEAEKYDKALVESWRSDMGGMLIFVRSEPIPSIQLITE